MTREGKEEEVKRERKEIERAGKESKLTKEGKGMGLTR